MASYTLTSNANTIAGSTLSDSFNGTYNAVSGVDTFNDNDILDGKEGIDTLNISHFLNVAITPPDALWGGINNIEKIVFNTTGDGAQTITTGSAFQAAFAQAGVNLTTTTSGAGAIDLTMSSFTGTATLATTSIDGAQTIVTGSNISTVAAISGAGALNIKGIGLTTVSAKTTGAGAQSIGDDSGNGANLVNVTAISAGGGQTVVSTSASAVTVNVTSNAGRQIIATGSGSDVITATTTAAINSIMTYAGNDIITVLASSAGSYTIDSGTGNDSIYGGAGTDALIGGTGNDRLSGGAGADTMTGGDGSDTYYVDNAGDVVTETNAVTAIGGIDHVHSYRTAYTLGANIENGRIILSTAANLTGNSLNNVLYAGVGNNTINGSAGTDTVSYLYGVTGVTGVTINLNSHIAQTTGGSGSDTLISIENVIGSANADSFVGTSAANRLEGGAGNDVLNGHTGADTMIGGDGSDIYFVENAGDVVTETNAVAATGGTDHVHSSLAAYTLGANVENGRILLSTAANLTGNSLNNLLYAGAGNNIMNGSTGTDTVSYLFGVTGAAGVTANLATGVTTGSGTDTLVGIENLIGSNNADSLTGGTGANTLSGGAGNDGLTGGAGADRLTGGLGADTFVYTLLTDSGITGSTWDTITDFSSAQLDKINLSGLDADTTTGSDDAFSVVVVGSVFSGAFATPGDLYFDNVNHVLYGNTDGDSAAEFAIALTGVTNLVVGNFVL